MDGSFRIGRLFGIPILIHYSFILVIPLFAWIIGSQITLTAEMLQGYFSIPIDTSLITEGFMPWILGTVIALGLFLGVLIHELAHSLVARKKGIKINSIMLMIFGGIATMDEGTPDPKAELPMALVGPIASLLVGLVCCGIAFATPAVITDPPLARVSDLCVRVSRSAQHHPLCIQSFTRIPNGWGQGAAGVAGRKDATPPCYKDCH